LPGGAVDEHLAQFVQRESRRWRKRKRRRDGKTV
jgi:hypothetical protein